VDWNRWMERLGRLPGAVPDASHEFAGGSSRCQRNATAIAQEDVSSVDQIANPHLQPFQR
jgi:hypothetical protein